LGQYAYAGWNGKISNREAKEAVGRQIATYVKDGDVLGVGSGSTAYLAIHSIAERARRGKPADFGGMHVVRSIAGLRSERIPVTSLLEARPDWYVRRGR